MSDAIFVEPNNAKIFFNKYKNSTIVRPGPILDGLTTRTKEKVKGHNLKKSIAEWEKSIVTELKAKKVDVLLSYLPVGSKSASIFYAKCAIKAKTAYANAMPEFICSSDKFSNLFFKAGIPCAGDDIKSQVGATIIHRVLIDIINKRGLKIDNTFQLNMGGNLDFLNMLDEDRLVSKRVSKTEAVIKNASNQKFNTKIGPSDYIEFLNDNKICFIEINGRQFGGVPFKLELKLSVEDSPNSAGVMVDVVRLLKICLDKKLKGYQDFSSFYFKHPKKNINDGDAYKDVMSMFVN
ncbi:MAG: inositol-3-phosphate synthase [Candidatus Pacebacteria bacterium]|nr:inositol-3-phosphate synthase [Candidatus Paceibacterota bacterium]